METKIKTKTKTKLQKAKTKSMRVDHHALLAVSMT